MKEGRGKGFSMGCHQWYAYGMQSSRTPPVSQEQNRHSLSQVPEDRHRRLSVCSLPVLKQFGESLGSLISVAQSANGRTWQSARCVILFFFCRRRFLRRCAPVSFCRHEVSLYPIHGEQIRNHLPTPGP